MTARRLFLPLVAMLAALAVPAAAQESAWSTFNGDLRAQKFSPLTQITPENVGGLERAWTTHTGDVWPNPHGRRPLYAA